MRDKLKLEGKKMYLESFETKHLKDPRYLSWLRDPEVMKTIGGTRLEYVNKQVEFREVNQYVEDVWKSDNMIFFALYSKPENLFVGTVKINITNHTTKEADLGIMVGDKNYWGKGLATDAIAAVCRFSFSTLGLRKLTAGAMSVNPAMINVFKRLGFVQEGLLRKRDLYEGDYIDHFLFGCFKEEFKDIIS